VWVELGLQTANDNTAKIINRGYPLATFEYAYKLLSEYGIRVVVHMIIGLPGEGECEVKQTADYIAALSPFGVKIHSIYVMRGTVLEKMYNENRYTPPTLAEYSALCAYTLSQMPEKTVIHRITGDCPRGALVAPQWNADKRGIIDAVNAALGLIKNPDVSDIK
jgi:radical SAM protein (TIGR01212 family)